MNLEFSIIVRSFPVNNFSTIFKIRGNSCLFCLMCYGKFGIFGIHFQVPGEVFFVNGLNFQHFSEYSLAFLPVTVSFNISFAVCSFLFRTDVKSVVK